MVKELLKQLTGKNYVYLVNRGNTAIKLVVQNLDKALIQDQGGWLTYKQFPKEYLEVKTNLGLTDLDDLKQKKANAFLCNSCPAYYVYENMKEIRKVWDNLLINDVSGSIGTENGKIGDILLGSFGKWKLINLEYGGFVASDHELNIEENFDLKQMKKLKEKIVNLPKRLKFLQNEVKKVKEELENFDIIHRDNNALNVIVKYCSLEEKNKLINYCKGKYDYVECPKYIKVLTDAISIEIKRKNE